MKRWMLPEERSPLSFYPYQSREWVIEAVPRHMKIKEPQAKRILKDPNAE